MVVAIAPVTNAGWLAAVHSATVDSGELYIAVVFVVTIDSLRNRPQGSKLTYGAAIIPAAPRWSSGSTS